MKEERELRRLRVVMLRSIDPIESTRLPEKLSTPISRAERVSPQPRVLCLPFLD